MTRALPIAVIVGSTLLAACAQQRVKGTLAELHEVRPDLQEAKVEQGLDKAMQSYRRYLDETPRSALTPEAMRRLADLKIENLQVKPEGAFTLKLEEVKAGQAYKVVLGIAPDAKKGYSRGTVSIKTNVPGETDLQVYFYALLN